MNKIIKITLALVLLVWGSACTDLAVQGTDSLIESTTAGFKPTNPTVALESAYKDFGAYTDQANMYALGTHTSAELIPPTRGVDWGDNGVWRTLDQHTWDATHEQVRNSWNQLNQRSYRCNEILASSPSALQAAEAKFLRAFHMSHIMDFFGQVPIRQVTEGPEVNPKVMSRSEAFDFIIKDLTEALPVLPKVGPDKNGYKASKATAYFLLARLYLNKHIYKGGTPASADMKEVVKNVDLLTAEGFSLEDKYFTNFTKDASKEIIMTTLEGSPQNRWRMTMHYDQNPDGWNGFTTLSDFYSKFQANDQRIGEPAKKDGTDFSGTGKGFLRGQQFNDKGVAIVEKRGQTPLIFSDDIKLSGANVKQGIRVIKYHPADANKYILMRYADAVLMKAEAQLRDNDAAGALVTANLVRAKRNPTPLASPLTLDALFDERRRELYWEGYGRQDEIRFGKFTSGTGVTNKGEHTTLFPIPANALTSNPNLKQNPGY
jgi:starch-binding outer membrane protein, SusD/RagB family